MIIRTVNLETVCGVTSRLPDNRLPEIAFAGKSNVGKSSLINAVMNRKSLARTSSQPGKTQTINFYNVNDRFYLVDLPGYGYARANEQVKAQWGKMIERYLHGSKQLKAVFLLVDIRHDPTRDDVTMYNYLFANNLPFTVVATKADKVSKSQVRNRVRSIAAFLKVGEGNVIALSSLTEAGKQQVLDRIQQVLESDNAAKEQQE